MAAVNKEKWQTLNSGPVPLAIVCVGVFFVHARFWLLPLWQRNKRDAVRTHHFREEAERVLRNPEYVLNTVTEAVDEPSDTFMDDWAQRFQMITTAALLLAAFFLK